MFSFFSNCSSSSDCLVCILCVFFVQANLYHTFPDEHKKSLAEMVECMHTRVHFVLKKVECPPDLEQSDIYDPSSRRKWRCPWTRKGTRSIEASKSLHRLCRPLRQLTRRAHTKSVEMLCLPWLAGPPAYTRRAMCSAVAIARTRSFLGAAVICLI